MVDCGRMISVCGWGGKNFMLFNNGTVFAWGVATRRDLGVSGEVEKTEEPNLVLGLSEIQSVAVGQSCSLALDKYGTARFFGDTYLGRTGGYKEGEIYFPREVPGLSKIKSIAAVGSVGIFLDSMGNLYLMRRLRQEVSLRAGKEFFDKPMISKKVKRIKTIAVFGDQFGALDENGVLYLHTGPLPVIAANVDFNRIEGPEFIKIALGFNMILGLTQEGDLYCKDGNTWGQLGTRNLTKRHDFEKIPGIKEIENIVSGVGYILAYGREGKIFYWGWSGESLPKVLEGDLEILTTLFGPNTGPIPPIPDVERVFRELRAKEMAL